MIETLAIYRLLLPLPLPQPSTHSPINPSTDN